MKSHHALIDTLSHLLSGNEIFTLIKRVQLKDNIVDGQYITYSSDAAALYGYDETDLSHTWQSETLTPDVCSKSYQIGVARQLHPELQLPAEYITTIRRRNGEVRPVIKTTQAMIITDEWHWLTIIDPHLRKTRLPHIDELQLPAWVMKDIPRIYSLSEINSMLENLPLQNSQSGNSISHTGNQASPALDNIENRNGVFKEHLNIEPGETIGVPDGRWLHRCKECGYIWLNKQRRPVKCANRTRNASKRYVCQTTKWWKGSGPAIKYKQRHP
ncbi:MAG: hypothetical protein ETSY1_41290 [Candidatus Entotheonella factor]|uniref:PAS domain-containing protein n=1 Tax=Entotheonella factor TaxID=1429438 RepID=W4L515_ENTF1|nr:MAG: hypothetical protein ETSY1_41290 [Candidatus Entotheonella factor]